MILEKILLTFFALLSILIMFLVMYDNDMKPLFKLYFTCVSSFMIYISIKNICK